MAAPRKKQAKKFKFELSGSAIAGVGVVLFCIFLWMFLLGIWTGESVLRPRPRKTPDPQRSAVLLSPEKNSTLSEKSTIQSKP
jgi:hypothetical protein